MAEYHFDDNADDSSGNGNNGVINGAAFVPGVSGQALGFDGGSNRYVVGNTAGNNFPTGSSARTISAWIKTDAAAGVDRNIFHYGTIGGGSPKNFHLYANGVILFGNGYGYGVIGGTSTINDNNWHYVAGVYEGPGTNIARIYVDGFEQTAGTLSSIPDTGTGSNWMIGTFLGGGTSFNGIIDEVRIYNRALTASEIQARYDEIANPSQVPEFPTLALPILSVIGLMLVLRRRK